MAGYKHVVDKSWSLAKEFIAARVDEDESIAVDIDFLVGRMLREISVRESQLAERDAELAALRSRLTCEYCDGPVNEPEAEPVQFGACRKCLEKLQGDVAAARERCAEVEKQLEHASREPSHYVGNAWFVGDFVIEPLPGGGMKWRRQHTFKLESMTGYATPE